MAKLSERTRTLSEHIKQMLEALKRKPIPENGICSHHGVGAPLKIGGLTFYVEITHDVRTDGTGKLLVKCYHSEWVGPPDDRREAPIGRGLVAKIRHECRAVGPIIDEWNLTAAGRGGSLVLDVECPESLRDAQARYYKVKDVFNPTKTENARFKRFDAWFRLGMGLDE